MRLTFLLLRTDSHIHVAILGESQYFVDLADCYSMASLKDKVKSHIARYPDLPWVIGVNWDQTNLGAFPHRRDVDEIHATKPVSYNIALFYIALYFVLLTTPRLFLQMFLWRACWHIGLANTAALKLAHIVEAPTGKDARVRRTNLKFILMPQHLSFQTIFVCSLHRAG